MLSEDDLQMHNTVPIHLCQAMQTHRLQHMDRALVVDRRERWAAFAAWPRSPKTCSSVAVRERAFDTKGCIESAATSPSPDSSLCLAGRPNTPHLYHDKHAEPRCPSANCNASDHMQMSRDAAHGKASISSRETPANQTLVAIRAKLG